MNSLIFLNAFEFFSTLDTIIRKILECKHHVTRAYPKFLKFHSFFKISKRILKKLKNGKIHVNFKKSMNSFFSNKIE